MLEFLQMETSRPCHSIYFFHDASDVMSFPLHEPDNYCVEAILRPDVFRLVHPVPLDAFAFLQFIAQRERVDGRDFVAEVREDDGVTGVAVPKFQNP